ncbi:MAG: caspase family protein, partial [Bacteroidetes bacterium]|nr:caspase family protein [Bacteroidota bacterium]
VNGDETDGWDETLVMQDSRVGDILDLSDDELNSLMTQLCSKTPNVTLILDACHSGTGTKAVAVPRRVERDERRPRNNGQANATKQAQGTSDFRDEDMKYVLISGCTSNQLSYEHYVGEKSYGALSYFLIKELWAATGPVTYRDIMDNVKSKVKAHYSNQYPQLEGANSDQFIFSDSSSLAEAYILVDPYEDDKVTIHVGDIHGVTKGSIFEVYAPNTKKISKQTPIAKVRVMQVKPYKSLGKIMSGKVTKDQSRAVETEHMFSNEKLRVYFTKSRSAKFIKALTKTHDLPFVKEAESEAKSNLIITERSGNIYIGLPSEDVTSHKRFSSNDPHIDVKIAEEVERWAKWFNVLSITTPDPYLDFRLELVSIDPPEGSKGSLDLGKPEYTFSDGEKFEMIITNLSYYDVFIHVLDLEANGNITVLFPDDGAQELLESFGEWRDTVEAYLPPGISKTADVIKVFVTTNGLVNLKFLESAGAGTKGASEYDLENVLITSARPVRPSDAGKSLGLNEWNTTMRVLEVKR